MADHGNGSQVAASSAAVRQLAGKISTGMKTVNRLNTDLDQKLKKLGVSFQDSGYQTVAGYVKSSKNKVEAALPDLKTVMAALLEYAALLEQSEKEVH